MEDALRRGDRDRVARILKERKSNKVLRDLSQALLDGDEDRVARLSKQCVDGAFAAKAVPLALHCNRTLASTYFERGQTSDWALRMKWFQDTGFPALRGNANGDARLGGAYGKLDYGRLAQLPRQSQSRLADRRSVAVSKFPSAASKLWNPVVAITINGVEVEALLDTGTTASLGLRPEVAQRVKVKTVAEGLPIVGSSAAAFDPSRDADAIGTANEVRIGPLKIENMGVTVTPALPKGVSALIGLSLLQRFDTVSISDRRIEFSLAGGGVCQDSVPLTYSSAGKGIGKLLLPAKLKGRAQHAVLDTGLQGLFMALDGLANELGADRLPKRDYSLRLAEGWTSRSGAETRLEAEVGNRTLTDPAARLFPSARADVPFYIGASLLDQYDLSIDFTNAKACMMPKTD